ncbi:MAG: hypothetical protein HOC71_08455 [Candidatus Latescibacteria bacterium]|nr:hypothetical protein [Candidatus Latescibacterota bacterium]
MILVDLPGHGRSYIPSESYPYTIEYISNDIGTLPDKLGFEQFHHVC